MHRCADSPFSHLDNMSNSLKFSKVFSNSAFAIENIQPYYFRATSTPLPEDISLITHITVASWPQLERLAENWQGEFFPWESDRMATHRRYMSF